MLPLTFRRVGVVALAAGAFALLAETSDAATVSGTLRAGRGYTVMALAPSGAATVTKVGRSGAFRLMLPNGARNATLQLLRPSGAYFGPLTLGPARNGRVPVALKGTTVQLGAIRLRRGFAATLEAVAASALGSAARAKASRSGAPIGAGKLGLVRTGGRASAHAAGGNRGAANGGTDTDRDGLPNAVDADDNGNGILDAVDPASARASGAGLFSEIQMRLENSLNANAGTVTRRQIDAMEQLGLRLNFWLPAQVPGTGARVSSIGVDCLRLAYCRAGDGTAIMSNGGNTPQALAGRLWRTLDDDHDGFLDLPASPSQPDVFSLQIQPNVPTADISPGDTYQFHMRTAGGDVVVPTTLTGYFVTTPAVATLNGQTVRYPVTNATVGSQTNPVRMTGDSLSVTLWRPQRAALPGERGELTDQGHLHYAVNVHNASNTMELACGGDYTGLSSTLRVASGGDTATQLFPLTDTADDAAPSAENTMSFTFDLGGCMRRNGVDPTGQLVPLPIMAVGESRPGGVDRTSQVIYVCFPGCTPPTMQGPPGP